MQAIPADEFEELARIVEDETGITLWEGFLNPEKRVSIRAVLSRQSRESARVLESWLSSARGADTGFAVLASMIKHMMGDIYLAARLMSYYIPVPVYRGVERVYAFSMGWEHVSFDVRRLREVVKSVPVEVREGVAYIADRPVPLPPELAVLVHDFTGAKELVRTVLEILGVKGARLTVREPETTVVVSFSHGVVQDLQRLYGLERVTELEMKLKFWVPPPKVITYVSAVYHPGGRERWMIGIRSEAPTALDAVLQAITTTSMATSIISRTLDSIRRCLPGARVEWFPAAGALVANADDLTISVRPLDWKSSVTVTVPYDMETLAALEIAAGRKFTVHPHERRIIVAEAEALRLPQILEDAKWAYTILNHIKRVHAAGTTIPRLLAVHVVARAAHRLGRRDVADTVLQLVQPQLLNGYLECFKHDDSLWWWPATMTAVNLPGTDIVTLRVLKTRHLLYDGRTLYIAGEPVTWLERELHNRGISGFDIPVMVLRYISEEYGRLPSEIIGSPEEQYVSA